MPKKRRSRSRSACARRLRRQPRPQRSSRPTAHWRAACLRRWNAGMWRSRLRPARSSPTLAGLFARLAAEAALDGVTPVALLALLKHPLLRLGAAAGAHARAIAGLEKVVLRGSRPRPGMAGLVHALTVFHTELAK